MDTFNIDIKINHKLSLDIKVSLLRETTSIHLMIRLQDKLANSSYNDYDYKRMIPSKSFLGSLWQFNSNQMKKKKGIQPLQCLELKGRRRLGRKGNFMTELATSGTNLLEKKGKDVAHFCLGLYLGSVCLLCWGSCCQRMAQKG